MRKINVGSSCIALVDDEDYERINKHRWQLSNWGYALRSAQKNKTYFGVTMHRAILNLTNPKILCDHVDGNKLNNQKSNLRVVDAKQNQYNKSKAKTYRGAPSLNRFKGVKKEKRTGKWVARICKDYKHVHLGTFANEQDAALAYNKAAKNLFGSYAKLNRLEFGE